MFEPRHDKNKSLNGVYPTSRYDNSSMPKRGSSVGSNVSRTEIELVLPVVNS